MPGRVNSLELRLQGVEREVHLVREEQRTQTAKIDAVNSKMDQIVLAVNKLFWTGAGVFMACSTVLGLIKIFGIEIDL